MKNEQKFISLLSDYGFKTAFADESNTLFLRKALQALIQSPAPIKGIQFLRNEFVGITEHARGGVFDLICIDENEQTFIVEMQLGYYKHFIQRAKFYAFQRFNTLVEKGKYQFDDLTPIYCIGFLAKGIFPESNQYYHFGRLKNQIGEELDSQITHIIIEIDKFGKETTALQTDLDKLIYIMKNLEHIKGIDQLPKTLTEDWIEQAMNKLDKSQMTPDQRMYYEMMMAKNASIIEMLKEEKQKIIKETAEIAAKEGLEKGLKKGLKQGLRQGLEQGLEKGVEQGLEKAIKQMAKQMREAGEPMEKIVQYTRLTQKEIECL